MRARTLKRSLGLQPTILITKLFTILGVIQALYGGWCSCLLPDGRRNEEEQNLAWLRGLHAENYSRNFINLNVVKFIDSSSLRWPPCYILFPRMTLVTVHVVNIFTFIIKHRCFQCPVGECHALAWLPLLPWWFVLAHLIWLSLFIKAPHRIYQRPRTVPRSRAWQWLQNKDH